jgi:hypothetical protein
MEEGVRQRNPDQKLDPDVQPLIRRIRSAERTMLITSEPRHPRRFEKKTNTSAPSEAGCATWVPGSVSIVG